MIDNPFPQQKIVYERVAKAALRGVDNSLERVGRLGVNEARLTLSQTGTGRTYRRGNVSHTASAPGQPPAVDTGRLRASTSYRVMADAKGKFVELIWSAAYASELEFGTGRMAPRPFARPTVAKVLTRLRDALDAIADEERRAAR